MSHARLENPDAILSDYLGPALQCLNGRVTGPEAGKVFHQFATYCHKQLDSQDMRDDLKQSQRLLRQRTAEAQELTRTRDTTSSKPEKDSINHDLKKVNRWRSVHKLEVERLDALHDQFLRSSLENYLKSLGASDDFDADVMRFVAIWFAHADTTMTNEPVSELSKSVPTRKFAPLMNQLSSRLQETSSRFQDILGDLVIRICTDHPYHGMHQVFASSRSTSLDSQSQSRQGAASRIARRLTQGPTSDTWRTISRANELYTGLAQLEANEFTQGAKLSMSKYSPCRKVVREVPVLQVAPITMTIDISEDLDYSRIAVLTDFADLLMIPGGVSAPKIVTARASDGKSYKQLVSIPSRTTCGNDY